MEVFGLFDADVFGKRVCFSLQFQACRIAGADIYCNYRYGSLVGTHSFRIIKSDCISRQQSTTLEQDSAVPRMQWIGRARVHRQTPSSYWHAQDYFCPIWRSWGCPRRRARSR